MIKYVLFNIELLSNMILERHMVKIHYLNNSQWYIISIVSSLIFLKYQNFPFSHMIWISMEEINFGKIKQFFFRQHLQPHINYCTMW